MIYCFDTLILEFMNLLGDGIFELKFDFGPGYRVYFGFKINLETGNEPLQFANLII